MKGNPRPNGPAERRDRIGWLILMWIAGVIELASVGVFFRILMNAAGLI